MTCGYSLGAIKNVLELTNYATNTTVKLLEYEINRENDSAIIALADLYANNVKLFDQKRALDLYTRAKNIDDVGDYNILKIIKTDQFEWSIKYHSIWPEFNVKSVKTYRFGKGGIKTTLFETSFQSQVFLLMLILKYKHLSCFPFTKLMYKNVVLAIITQLAKFWLDDIVVD